MAHKCLLGVSLSTICNKIDVCTMTVHYELDLLILSSGPSHESLKTEVPFMRACTRLWWVRNLSLWISQPSIGKCRDIHGLVIFSVQSRLVYCPRVLRMGISRTEQSRKRRTHIVNRHYYVNIKRNTHINYDFAITYMYMVTLKQRTTTIINISGILF